MRKLTHAMLAALAVCFAGPAFADGHGDDGPDVAAPPVHAAPIQAPASNTGRTGQISLMNGDVVLNVPAGYRFYPAEDALAYTNRNHVDNPNGTVLGLLAKADANIQAPDTWATVVSYDPINYVQPETASGLSSATLEADVRAARQTQNRRFEGFAIPPAFDATGPSVMWAERTAAPGTAAGKDFRFEQRKLGRKGVVGLTSVGAADQMPDIQAAAADLLGMISFPEGSRQTDFQAGTDTVSNYSVPALVTGVAATEPQAVAETSSAGQGTGQTTFGGLPSYFPWLAGGVVLLAIGGYMVMRRRRSQDDVDDDHDTDA